MKIYIKTNVDRPTIEKHRSFIIKSIHTIIPHTVRKTDIHVEIMEDNDEINLIVTAQFFSGVKTFEKKSGFVPMFDDLLLDIYKAEPVINKESFSTLDVVYENLNPEVIAKKVSPADVSKYNYITSHLDNVENVVFMDVDIPNETDDEGVDLTNEEPSSNDEEIIIEDENIDQYEEVSDSKDESIETINEDEEDGITEPEEVINIEDEIVDDSNKMIQVEVNESNKLEVANDLIDQPPTYKPSIAIIIIKSLALLMSFFIVYLNTFTFGGTSDSIFSIYEVLITNPEFYLTLIPTMVLTGLATINYIFLLILIFIIIFNITKMNNKGMIIATIIGIISVAMSFILIKYLNIYNELLLWSGVGIIILGVTGNHTKTARKIVDKQVKELELKQPIRRIVSPIRNIGKVLLFGLVTASLAMSIFLFVKVSPDTYFTMIEFVKTIFQNLALVKFKIILLLISLLLMLIFGVMSIVYNLQSLNKYDSSGISMSLTYGITAIITNVLFHLSAGITMGSFGFIIVVLVVVLSCVSLSFDPMVDKSEDGILEKQVKPTPFKYEDQIANIEISDNNSKINNFKKVVRRFIPILTLLASLFTLSLIVIKPLNIFGNPDFITNYISYLSVLDILPMEFKTILIYVVYVMIFIMILFFITQQVFLSAYSTQQLFNKKPNHKRLFKHTLISISWLLILSLLGMIFNNWVFIALNVNILFLAIVYATIGVILLIFLPLNENEHKYSVYLLNQVKKAFRSEKENRSALVAQIINIIIYIALISSLFLTYIKISFLGVTVSNLSGFSMITYSTVSSTTNFLGDYKLSMLLSFMKPVYLIITMLLIIGLINNIKALFSKTSTSSYNIKNAIVILILFTISYIYLLFLPSLLANSDFELTLYGQMFSSNVIINIILAVIALITFIITRKALKQVSTEKVKAFESVNDIIYQFKYVIVFVTIYLLIKLFNVVFASFIYMSGLYVVLPYIGVIATIVILIPMLLKFFKRYLNNFNIGQKIINTLIVFITLVLITFISVYIHQIIIVLNNESTTNVLYLVLESSTSYLILILMSLFVIVSKENKTTQA